MRIPTLLAIILLVLGLAIKSVPLVLISICALWILFRRGQLSLDYSSSSDHSDYGDYSSGSWWGDSDSGSGSDGGGCDGGGGD